MSIRVATVLSAREWEPSLVAHAHATATVRIVLRAYQPSDIEQHASDIDVVVAGGEVAWVTPRQIMTWKRLGLGVVGMFPSGDRPAADVLASGGADEVLPDSVDTTSLVQALRFAAPRDPNRAPFPVGTLTVVTGPRGAPGCTEVAIAHALEAARRHEVVLIDLDFRAPSIAIRLGLPPRPDITDVADAVRADGHIDIHAIRRYGPLSIITGSHRDGEPELSPSMVRGVVDASRAAADEVVLDVGTAEGDAILIDEADDVIAVVDASAVGIVRAAHLVSTWSGPKPHIVVNRVPSGDRANVVEAVRTWTGLEPAALIPDHRKVRSASLAARPPDRRVTRALAQVERS